jgi:acetate kinase
VSLIQRSVAAMSAAIEGLDGLVFIGGTGEASSWPRADHVRGPHHHVKAAADMVVTDLVELLESCWSCDGPAVPP